MYPNFADPVQGNLAHIRDKLRAYLVNPIRTVLATTWHHVHKQLFHFNGIASSVIRQPSLHSASLYSESLSIRQSLPWTAEFSYSEQHDELMYDLLFQVNQFEAPDLNVQTSCDTGTLSSNQAQELLPAFSFNNDVVDPSGSLNLGIAQTSTHFHNGFVHNPNQAPDLQSTQVCDQLLGVFGHESSSTLPADGVVSQPLSGFGTIPNQYSEMEPHQVCDQLLEMFGYKSTSTLPTDVMDFRSSQSGRDNQPVYESNQNLYRTREEAVNTPIQHIGVSFAEQNMTMPFQFYDSLDTLEDRNAATSGVPTVPSGSQPIPQDPVIPHKKSGMSYVPIASGKKKRAHTASKEKFFNSVELMDASAYKCTVPGCTKVYKFPCDLVRHDKRAHRGIITFQNREKKRLERLEKKIEKQLTKKDK
ncbi:hypothetical protein DFH28DRAFT_1168128 [Melampsora americana]|nr:hypothetical protein DFH28DRAFT_1168128 [Melampsora americana]